MIYGNHNKRRGDIVRVARWDQDLVQKAADFLHTTRPIAETKEFVVSRIDYYGRTMHLMPKGLKEDHGRFFIVNLDDTNLIRVGRLGSKE